MFIKYSEGRVDGVYDDKKDAEEKYKNKPKREEVKEDEKTEKEKN